MQHINGRNLGIAVALAAVLATAPAAWAQRGPSRGNFGNTGGGAMLLGQKAIQEDLKLSADQVKQIDDLLAKQREAFGGASDLSREERRERFEKSRAEGQTAISSVLTEEQQQRFKQISLQLQGPAALSDEELAKKVGLSDEQKKNVEEIQSAARAEMRRQFQGGPGSDRRAAMEKVRAAREEMNTKIQAVLTAEQKAKWDELTGEPFKGQLQGPQRGGEGGRRRRNRDGAQVTPASETLNVLTADKSDGEGEVESKADKAQGDDDKKAEKKKAHGKKADHSKASQKRKHHGEKQARNHKKKPHHAKHAGHRGHGHQYAGHQYAGHEYAGHRHAGHHSHGMRGHEARDSRRHAGHQVAMAAGQGHGHGHANRAYSHHSGHRHHAQRMGGHAGHAAFASHSCGGRHCHAGHAGRLSRMDSYGFSQQGFGGHGPAGHHFASHRSEGHRHANHSPRGRGAGHHAHCGHGGMHRHPGHSARHAAPHGWAGHRHEGHRHHGPAHRGHHYASQRGHREFSHREHGSHGPHHGDFSHFASHARHHGHHRGHHQSPPSARHHGPKAHGPGEFVMHHVRESGHPAMDAQHGHRDHRGPEMHGEHGRHVRAQFTGFTRHKEGKDHKHGKCHGHKHGGKHRSSEAKTDDAKDADAGKSEPKENEAKHE